MIKKGDRVISLEYSFYRYDGVERELHEGQKGVVVELKVGKSNFKKDDLWAVVKTDEGYLYEHALVRLLALESERGNDYPSSLPKGKIEGMHQKGSVDIWFVSGSEDCYYLVRKTLVDKFTDYTRNQGQWCSGGEFMAFSADDQSSSLVNYELQLFKNDNLSILLHVENNGGVEYHMFLNIFKHHRQYLELPEVQAQMTERAREAYKRIKEEQ